EMTAEGVEARQLFYEGTQAYKLSNFDVAVQKFRDGLNKWKDLLDRHADYKTDEFNKKDTGLVVKRYVRALRQLGEPEPKDMPFRSLLAAAEADNTVNPFDAMEMLGPTRPSSGPGAAAGGPQRPAAPAGPRPSLAPAPPASPKAQP